MTTHPRPLGSTQRLNGRKPDEPVELRDQLGNRRRGFGTSTQQSAYLLPPSG
jgi:hypothetical protein